jgi:tRNA A37 N6-isopentenylltransferase MiaA
MSPSKSTAAINKKSKGFTDEEKAAMKARANELKAEANKAEGESIALEAIAKMKEPDRSMAKRLHTIIKASGLSAKTWYGMPAYANKDGKIVCYFRDRMKFKERYAMFAFNDAASLDEGSMWPIAYALPELTSADEAKIAALLKKAVS